MTEFKLSDEIEPYTRSLLVVDVKKFIRLLKNKGRTKIAYNSGKCFYIFLEEEIDKLAGDELI